MMTQVTKLPNPPFVVKVRQAERAPQALQDNEVLPPGAIRQGSAMVRPARVEFGLNPGLGNPRILPQAGGLAIEREFTATVQSIHWVASAGLSGFGGMIFPDFARLNPGWLQ